MFSVTVEDWSFKGEQYSRTLRRSVYLFESLIQNINDQEVKNRWKTRFEIVRNKMNNMIRDLNAYLKILSENKVDINCNDYFTISGGTEVNSNYFKSNINICLNFISEYNKEIINILEEMENSDNVTKTIPIKTPPTLPVTPKKKQTEPVVKKKKNKVKKVKKNTTGNNEDKEEERTFNIEFKELADSFQEWILNGFMCNIYEKKVNDTNKSSYNNANSILQASLYLLNVDSNDTIKDSVLAPVVIYPTEPNNLLKVTGFNDTTNNITKDTSLNPNEPSGVLKSPGSNNYKFVNTDYLKSKRFKDYLINTKKMLVRDINSILFNNPVTGYYTSVNMFVSIFSKLYYCVSKTTVNPDDDDVKNSFQTYMTVDFFTASNITAQGLLDDTQRKKNYINVQNEILFYSIYISQLEHVEGNPKPLDSPIFDKWMCENVQEKSIKDLVGKGYGLGNYGNLSLVTKNPNSDLFNTRSYSIYFNSFIFGYFNNFYVNNALGYLRPDTLVDIYVGLMWTPILTFKNQPMKTQKIVLKREKKLGTFSKFLVTIKYDKNGSASIDGISFPYLYNIKVLDTGEKSDRLGNVANIFYPFIPRKNIMFPIPSFMLENSPDKEEPLRLLYNENDVEKIGFNFYPTPKKLFRFKLFFINDNNKVELNRQVVEDIIETFMSYKYDSNVSLNSLFKKTMTNIVGPILLILNELYNTNVDEIVTLINKLIKLLNDKIFSDLKVKLSVYNYTNFKVIFPETQYDNLAFDSSGEKNAIFTSLKQISLYFSLFGTFILMSDYCDSVATFKLIIMETINQIKDL